MRLGAINVHPERSMTVQWWRGSGISRTIDFNVDGRRVFNLFISELSDEQLDVLADDFEGVAQAIRYDLEDNDEGA